ncbi:CGNR zinc finger domain-containing protein [Promicromonospora sp. NPDC019610]|uniref:CGNR zinc finger domain-containing protein n=1 Tax=Promicromonospora sp. NPDC019610 TaxID=3364405 RepID=UPI0037B705F4
MVSPNADTPDRLSPRTAARRTAALINVLAEDPTPEAVRRVLLAHGEPGTLVVTAADVEPLRRAARRLRPVFDAADLTTATAALNGLLARHTQRLRLTAHGGTAWHLHLDRDDDGPLDEWFLASACLAMAVLVWDRQQLPGGACRADGCERVFLAIGSGPEQRYCSRRCATRERVAAHRARARMSEKGTRPAGTSG